VRPASRPRSSSPSSCWWVALAALAVGAVNHRGTTAGTAGSDGILRGAVVIDGPALFIQSIILLFALLAVFTYAERLGGVGSDTFTPMGAAVPGSAARPRRCEPAR
jgi:NADH-quinone oxidoreductase subunit N